MNIKPGQAGGYYRASAATVLSSGALESVLTRYLVAVLAVVLSLVYLDFGNYASAINKGLPPKIFYAGYISLLVPLFLRFKTWVAYLLSPFALWTFVVVSINVVYLLSGIADGQWVRVDIAAGRIQMLLLALLLGMALFNVRRSLYEWIFPCLALLLPLLVFIDIALPGLLYPVGTPGSVRGRAAATFINPTTAGEAMLVLFLLACSVLKPLQRVGLMLIVGAGVLLTLSRSAIIAWFVLWIVLSFNRVLPRFGLVVVVTLGGAVPLLLGALSIYYGNQSDFGPAMADIEQRLNFFSTGSLSDASAVERAMVLKAGWDTFLSNMFVGTGPGAAELWPHATGSLGTHNQFVMLASEYGLCGVGVWLALGWILWHGKYFEERALQQAVFLMFVLMTPFTHNMFDFLFWLFTFSLASSRRRI